MLFRKFWKGDLEAKSKEVDDREEIRQKIQRVVNDFRPLLNYATSFRLAGFGFYERFYR